MKLLLMTCNQSESGRRGQCLSLLHRLHQRAGGNLCDQTARTHLIVTLLVHLLVESILSHKKLCPQHAEPRVGRYRRHRCHQRVQEDVGQPVPRLFATVQSVMDDHEPLHHQYPLRCCKNPASGNLEKMSPRTKSTKHALRPSPSVVRPDHTEASYSSVALRSQYHSGGSSV